MAETKAGTIKDYLKKIGKPFRKEEEEDKEESEPMKMEDLTPIVKKKNVPKGLKDAAKSYRDTW